MEKSTFTSEYAILRDHLVRIRKEAKLTQRDLAKRLDVPHSWVAKVESGERRLDLVELCLLLSACGAEARVICGELATEITRLQGKRHRKGKSPR